LQLRAGTADSAGDVNLKIPKLRRQTFETAIIERYRRRESLVEEALIEMYLAGISVRRVRRGKCSQLSAAISRLMRSSRI
jgi:transposase-like protein